MNQKKIKVTLKTPEESFEYNVLGYINEDRTEVSYIEKDEEKTFTSFNYRNNVLKRDNNNIYMEYDFDRSRGKVFFKEFNKELVVDLKVKNFEKTEESISVEYLNNGDLCTYNLLIVR